MSEPAPASLVAVTRGIHNWMLTPGDFRIVAVLRMGYAVLLTVNLWFLTQDAAWWYGDSGVLSHSEAVRLRTESEWWTVMPMLITDSAYVALGITGLATLSLFVGCWPRVSALVILVGLTVLHHRNPLILDGEDNLFRLFAFFLALIPSGTSWSLRRTPRSELPMLAPMPGLVLWRYQMSLIYLSTVWEKLNGSDWITGHAIYYISRLDDLFGTILAPSLIYDSLMLLRFVTWAVLLAEVFIAVGLWFRETRRWALVVAVCLHLSIELSMSLFLFQWLMLLGLIAFVTVEDVVAVRQRLGWIGRRLQILVRVDTTGQLPR